MKEIIAEREFLVIKPEGEEFVTRLQINKPYETDKHGWCCDLTMEGIDSAHYAAGADSLQAILLTLSLAESILISRKKEGWEFLYPDTRELMEVYEYIHWPEVIKYSKK